MLSCAFSQNIVLVEKKQKTKKKMARDDEDDNDSSVSKRVLLESIFRGQRQKHQLETINNSKRHLMLQSMQSFISLLLSLQIGYGKAPGNKVEEIPRVRKDIEKDIFQVLGPRNLRGMNLQAICDHKLRFLWMDINWPGSSSDYMAWTTSDLCHKLESNLDKMLLQGLCIAGDNAYVKKKYVSVPLKGIVSSYDDAYNFYLSQLRITIERTFGVFVHRWAILRKPLTVALPRVAPLIMCLGKLHNFCINQKESQCPASYVKDGQYLARTMSMLKTHFSKRIGVSKDDGVVPITSAGLPTSLLRGGHHFNDCPANCRRSSSDNGHTPMDEMREQVKKMNLTRPRN